MTEPTPKAYEAASRAYCLTKFDYHVPAYISDEARQSHIASYAADTAEETWLRAVVDAVWDLAEATVRAKVAAETAADRLGEAVATIRRRALLDAADKLQQMTMDPFDLLTESTGVANAVRVALWLRDEAARIAGRQRRHP